MWRKTFIVIALFVSFSGIQSASFAQPKMLSIRDCIQIALKNNPNLKNTERQIRLSGTNVTMARSTVLPSLGISFSGNRRFQAEQGPYLQEIPIQDPITGETRLVQKEIFLNSYYRNSFNTGISFNQNIFDGGKWWNRIKQSHAAYRSSEQSYDATREQVISTVVQKYYTLLKDRKLQAVYMKAVELAQEQYEKTKTMYEVGSVAQADVFKAKVSLGEQRINLIQQQNLVKSDRRNLNLALGWEPNRPIKIVDKELDIDPLNADMASIWNTAEQRNPELQSLQERVTRDQYGIKVAKGSFLPQISLNARYGRFNTEFDRLYDPLDKNYSVYGGISFSWNLFNGFYDAAQVEQASINYYMDKENLIKRKQSLKSEIEQAYLNMKAYEDIETINEDNLKAAQEDLRLNQERYRIGSGTLLEVIDSQVRLTRAQTTLITTKYNRLIELVKIYAKAGMLEDELKFIKNE